MQTFKTWLLSTAFGLVVAIAVAVVFGIDDPRLEALDARGVPVMQRTPERQDRPIDWFWVGEQNAHHEQDSELIEQIDADLEAIRNGTLVPEQIIVEPQSTRVVDGTTVTSSGEAFIFDI